MLRRRINNLMIGLLASSLLLAWPTQAQQTANEDDVKLALVYKIARFVSWPDTDVDPFLLCVTGKSTYAAANARLAGRLIRERAIRIERIRADDPHRPACDALYISRESVVDTNSLLQDYNGKPVLTVSDTSDFATRGGMVGLTLRNKRVGIQINVDNYERVGLNINSQLLQLADLVGERSA